MSKLESVYVVGRRGKSSGRATQFLRLDDPDGEGTFDHVDLARELATRLAQDPSPERTFIECRRLQSGEVIDRITLDASEDRPQLDDGSVAGVLAGQLVAQTDSATRMQERQIIELHRQLQELGAKNLELTEQVIQYQVLDAVGMRTSDLAAMEDDDDGEMSTAMAFLSPMLQLLMRRMMPQPEQIPASPPTSSAIARPPPMELAQPDEVSAHEDETAHEDESEVEGEIDWSAWGDDDADSLMSMLSSLAEHRPDLITDARIEAMFNSPLAGPIQVWITTQMGL